MRKYPREHDWFQPLPRSIFDYFCGWMLDVLTVLVITLHFCKKDPESIMWKI